MNGGQSPLTYKRFQTLISRMDAVELPAESITAEIMGKCSTPLSDDHDDKFGVPSLEELGESSQKTKHDQTETQDYRQSFNVVMFLLFFLMCRFRYRRSVLSCVAGGRDRSPHKT